MHRNASHAPNSALLRSTMLRSATCASLLSVAAVHANAAPEFEVYGFAQLDYIQDFGRVNPDWEATLRPSRIPTTSGFYGSDGTAIFSVRQSRLGVQSSMPVEGKDLTIKFEFDMFGVGDDAGQTTMRLRHAYGEWGNVLAGQTNSLFMDGDIFPNVVDYWGPAGMVFLRNPQIRWTPVRGESQLAVAIEKPGTDVDTGVFGRIDPNLNVQSHQEIPDITAQFRLQNDSGHLQVAGILRQLAYETANTPGNEPDGDELGWGINFTSSLKLGDDKLMAGLVYGEGIASYMNDGGTDLAPNNAGNNPAEAVPLTGALVYYDHYWTEQWSSSVGYSYTEVDNQRLQTGDAFESGEYASINLLHTPAKPLLMGVEMLWGKRTDNDGNTGTDTRIQLTLKYSFSSLDFQS